MRKIHKEGKTTILVNTAIFTALAILFILLVPDQWIKWPVAALCFALIVLMILFFRVSGRTPVKDDSLVISPVDGKVVSISEVEDPEFLQGSLIKVSIYLNLFNEHVTTFPVGGKCIYHKYHPGKYLFAWMPKSSDKNEHSTTVMLTPGGKQVMFRQIAGIIARRIVCYAKEGDDYSQGDEAGFIKFGSRADIFLPEGSEVVCKVGDKVKSRLSILARI